MKFLELRKMNSERKTGIPFAFGMAAFFLFAVSMMITSAVETSWPITLVRCAVTTCSVLCYLMCFWTSKGLMDYRRQISWINVFVLLYHLLFCIAVFYTAVRIRYYSVVYSEVLWIITGFLVSWYSKDVIASSIIGLRNKDTRFFFLTAVIISIVLVVLSYDVDGPHFVWDSYTIYNEMNHMEQTDLFNIGRFFIFRHIDAGYFYPILIISSIANNLNTGFWVYNTICLVAASFGIVFLVKKTIPLRNRVISVLVACACLLSPFICGMSTYYSYDFGICCLAPLLFLFAFEEDWIYFLITAIYICLLKETGVLLVCAVCIGILLMELVSDRISLPKALFRKRSLCVLFAVALYALYEMYAGWSDPVGTSFAVDGEHIMTLLKLYFLFNFEWAVTVCVLLFLLLYIFKKKNIPKYAVAYGISAFAFVIPNLFYVTYENPRYLDAFPLLMLLMMNTLFVSFIEKDAVLAIVLSVGAIIMAVSSFVSIDPVTNSLFFSADIGQGWIYASDSDRDFGGDQSVYNRQYYGQDIVFNEAIRVGIERRVDLIAVSTGRSNTTWGIDGGHYSYESDNERRYFTEFWNVAKQSRDSAYEWDYYADPGHIQMEIRYIFPGDDIVSALKERDSFIYIYMPSQNDGKEDAVRVAFEVIEEGQFSSHGWIMSYIRGKQR